MTNKAFMPDFRLTTTDIIKNASFEEWSGDILSDWAVKLVVYEKPNFGGVIKSITDTTVKAITEPTLITNGTKAVDINLERGLIQPSIHKYIKQLIILPTDKNNLVIDVTSFNADVYLLENSQTVMTLPAKLYIGDTEFIINSKGTKTFTIPAEYKGLSKELKIAAVATSFLDPFIGRIQTVTTSLTVDNVRFT